MKRCMVLFSASCFSALLGLSAVDAQQGAAIQSRPIIITNCPVRPLNEQRVPARVPGVLVDVKVKEGDLVVKGQELARVDDSKARIVHERKLMEQNNDVPLLIAAAEVEEAAARLEDEKKLKGFGTASKIRILKAQLEVAKLKADNAERDHKILKTEVESAKIDVEQHKVVSEINGIVREQVRNVGEAVQALDPIFHVIDYNEVKVEASFPRRFEDRIAEGMVIDVYPNKQGSEERIFFGHVGTVNSVEFLGGGALLASAGESGVIRAWSLTEGRQVRELPGHDGPVYCLAASPADENRLVSGGADRTIRVWDVDKGSEISAIPLAGGAIRSLALHPTDPKICFTGHEDRSIRVIDLEQGREIKRLPPEHTNYVTSLAVTKDGDVLLSSGEDDTVRLWDWRADKQIKRFPGCNDDVNQIGLSPDGKTFLFPNRDQLHVRAIPDGLPVSGLEGPSEFAHFAVFAPIQGLLLTSDNQDNMQLWRLGEAGRYPRLVRTYQSGDEIQSVAFTPDGLHFASAGEDGAVRVWGVPTLERIDKEVIRGTITFINPQVDSENSELHAEIENKGGVLIPGSFATMIIYPGQPAVARRDR